MTQWGRTVRSGILVLAALPVVCGDAVASESASPRVYRIFLTGGDILATYGDFARVGDRVVFSMPFGLDTDPPTTQLVSIPASSVDWPTTEQYAESVRYHYYASTRGEADFSRLTTDVARVLNQIATTPEPSRRLDMALDAREQLVAWTRSSYGYRAEDIRQFVGLLDGTISDLQAAAGVGAGNGGFELSFVATTERPAPVALMDNPTLQELIAQALTVSRIAPEPAERAAVLQSVLMILDGPAVDAPVEWRVTTRAMAGRALAGELAVERAYRDLTNVIMARATAYAGRADVRAVTALPGEVLERDGALGRQRPNQIAALLAALEVRVDSARRLKLARDRWQLRLEAYRRYERAIEPALEELDGQRQSLDDIRLLAGPAPQALPDLALRLEAASRTLSGLAAPSELLEVHVLFTRALQLASSAATLRGRAVTTGELRTAWDASAAAAGSLMLIERAFEELGRVLKAPELN